MACSVCGTSPAKLKVHAGRCRELVEKGLVLEISGLDESSQDSSGTVTSSDFESPPAKKRCVIPVVSTKGPLQQQIATQICRMVAATNSPFSLLNHPEFHRLMQLMRPGIRLPSCKDVGGKLLDEVYETTVEKAKTFCKGQYGCLSVDGWSMTTRDLLIGISLTCAGHTYLVNTVGTSGAQPPFFYIKSPPLRTFYVDKVEVGRLKTPPSSGRRFSCRWTFFFLHLHM